MALIIKDKVTQKKDGTELYIEVEEATGVYDVDDNPGGFGSPNPLRADTALVFYGLHQKSSGAVEVVPLSYDPTTVESFTFSLISKDGHWHYYIYAIPIYDDQASYSDGDVVYDNTTDPGSPEIKKYVDASSSFVVVQASELTSNASVTKREGNTFPIPESSDHVNNLRKQHLLLLKDMKRGDADPEDWEAKHLQFVFARDTLNTAADNFCASAYAEAQKEVEDVLNQKKEILGSES